MLKTFKNVVMYCKFQVLRGPRNGRLSKRPRVAKKSMDVRLGAVRGVKNSPGGSAGARRRLGGGVRFEKGVPRAALVRARLTNKLIRFREFIIFRIFRRIKCVRSDTPWAGGLANLITNERRCKHTINNRIHKWILDFTK